MLVSFDISKDICIHSWHLCECEKCSSLGLTNKKNWWPEPTWAKWSFVFLRPTEGVHRKQLKCESHDSCKMTTLHRCYHVLVQWWTCIKENSIIHCYFTLYFPGTSSTYCNLYSWQCAMHLGCVRDVKARHMWSHWRTHQEEKSISS